MKNLIFIITLLLFAKVANSQNLENFENQFFCSVGLLDDSKYPFEMIPFNYNNDIIVLSNGKRFPILSIIKNKIESDTNWVLMYKNDTTKIESIELIPKGEIDAEFIVNGINFSKSLDTQGLILKMNDDIIIFRKKNGKEWKLIRIN